ncbi:hypothetical protein D3C80_1942930 [compost metagenome]
MDFKTMYYINCVLSAAGIVGSLYVLGWVDHENHTIIGSTCFLLFLSLLVGSVINYNVISNRNDKE